VGRIHKRVFGDSQRRGFGQDTQDEGKNLAEYNKELSKYTKKLRNSVFEGLYFLFRQHLQPV